MLNRNRILGLICGYYLSRFDEVAYARFGFGNKSETHAELARRLEVPANTIKNWRDEFDPIHENARQGWHQRPMSRSRVRIVDALSQLSEFELHSIVLAILKDQYGPTAHELLNAIGEDDAESPELMIYGLRGPTGFAAERHFEDYHIEFQLPHPGILIDCRHEQCGYDYKIDSGDKTSFVEVKGLAGESGGLCFTNKEWQTAIEFGEQYYLVVVKNANDKAVVLLIQNPASKLKAEMRVFTAIQTTWTARVS